MKSQQDTQSLSRLLLAICYRRTGIAQGKYPFSVLTEAELQAIKINNVPIVTA